LSRPLPPTLTPDQPLTALAPMQDVTDLPFMRVIHHYGDPDYYFTEYFRVHAQSRLEPHILRSIVENDTGRPVFAQMIGESIPDLVRTAKRLAEYPVAGIDLNMGCPAPKIYKKNCGGGLLRDVGKIDQVLGALRAAVPGRFTVKMRIGFETADNFPAILEEIDRHGVDLLSLHAHTVREGYRGEAHYEYVKQAVQTLSCPVLANGNILSSGRAVKVAAATGCRGLMVGRHAIRNPWIFRQIRDAFARRPVFRPTLGDAREYIDRLYRATRTGECPERAHVSKMKKYLNFLGQSVDPEGGFLYDMRRAQTESELFAVCDRHLMKEPAAPFADEPHPGVIARPNCEGPAREESVPAPITP
jgi:tRNA-dihydrouridine synthase B